MALGDINSRFPFSDQSVSANRTNSDLSDRVIKHRSTSSREINLALILVGNVDGHSKIFLCACPESFRRGKALFSSLAANDIRFSDAICSRRGLVISADAKIASIMELHVFRCRFMVTVPVNKLTASRIKIFYA